MQAMTRSWLPHWGQVSMSIANTRLRRYIQLMGATGLSRFTAPSGRRGTIRLRCLKFGANTPWKRVRFRRGLGTRAARRAMKCVVAPDRLGLRGSDHLMLGFMPQSAFIH